MKSARVALFVTTALMTAIIQAEPVTVQNLRMWQAPESTRLVFDLSAPLEHRLFVLRDPDRVVIDMENARLLGELPTLDFSGPRLAGVRTGTRGDNQLRVVLDLKQPMRPRTFVLKPFEQYGHRLVIDLELNASPERRVPVTPRAQRPRSEVVIAIDAGHGGEDPGAIGRRYRTYEKDVVLAVARELKELVDKTRGLRAIMIRDGDYYVKLRDRYEKARHAEADIFISIHADALASRHRAYGASVYALSERGASSAQAQALADKENAADLIGGVSLSDKDTLLAKVLLDLSQTATISSSLELGADVLRELGRVGPIHLDTVQQAGFAVLKAPDVPSILIETTFISNPTEEKKLRNKPYQRKLAAAVFNGIQSYLTRQLPRSPQLAGSGPRTYIVQPGDTLVGIARDYGVHVDTLRFANSLTGTDLRVGRRLVIP